ncbi:hypothetical protein GW17_00039531 [Ensete ventricosum]|nr:hypothetical protein GW17_00039531 [Ensete ventricosum]
MGGFSLRLGKSAAITALQSSTARLRPFSSTYRGNRKRPPTVGVCITSGDIHSAVPRTPQLCPISLGNPHRRTELGSSAQQDTSALHVAVGYSGDGKKKGFRDRSIDTAASDRTPRGLEEPAAPTQRSQRCRCPSGAPSPTEKPPHRFPMLSQLSFHHFALLRCFFVSASLDDKLYISSGLGLRSTAPNSWDIYHSDSDSWISHKNPLHNQDIIKLIALEGKLCTIHKSWDGFFAYAGIYDPASATWQGIDNEIALSTYGPTVVVEGVLYMLQETSGMRLMKWQEERKKWVAIGRLSSHLTRPPCHLVAIGRSIYVIGQRLSTVVIDVDEAAKVEGLMVSSSFSPRFDCDHTIISCNTITI